jgi:hypothetical protein
MQIGFYAIMRDRNGQKKGEAKTIFGLKSRINPSFNTVGLEVMMMNELTQKSSQPRCVSLSLARSLTRPSIESLFSLFPIVICARNQLIRRKGKNRALFPRRSPIVSALGTANKRQAAAEKLPKLDLIMRLRGEEESHRPRSHKWQIKLTKASGRESYHTLRALGKVRETLSSAISARNFLPRLPMPMPRCLSTPKNYLIYLFLMWKPHEYGSRASDALLTDFSVFFFLFMASKTRERRIESQVVMKLFFLSSPIAISAFGTKPNSASPLSLTHSLLAFLHGSK